VSSPVRRVTVQFEDGSSLTLDDLSPDRDAVRYTASLPYRRTTPLGRPHYRIDEVVPGIEPVDDAREGFVEEVAAFLRRRWR
jgi:hypothetical protein